ncbi:MULTISPECIES: PLP-dependent aminotransferase family protein [unclassified Trinickia]|jgi:DNA-binding transcriptional MocR family regulator|uniref:aminotransferase-like domain-containing protein n=1 Tax=unclassified Trinickia TaxID=2638168 RepID=UPI0024065C92|nr:MULTISPECIES: PLP-dependent aminotransferase family protein [unclassified Trinickia]MDG0023224.1 PLP-dependent aminotransferase family protein [Trinickia sp. Y13]HVW52764.1 PLP-dependent aminotransferase family protein [Trinickia sp.]
MKIAIDRESGVPMTEQIVSSMEQWIRSREAHAGAKLPSIRQLAQDCGISRFPVIEAYDRLVSLGYIESRHGSGFYVSARAHAALDRCGASDPRRAEDESNYILQQFNHPGDTLKLGSGFIPEAWRDMDGIAQAVRHVARADQSALTDYATPLGSGALREHLQARIAPLGIRADASQILITFGASQAVDLIVRYLLRAGDTMFVEDPGYYNLFGLLKLHGINVVGIPRTASGPDIEVLQAELKRHRPRAVFINSVFHNPTGTVLAPSVAFRLLQLAHEYDFTLIEDDIYADFQSETTDRLAALDQLERVIYIGGLSKTLSSSLRIGFVAASRRIVKDLGDIKMLTSISGSPFAEAVALTMLERGAYRKFLERLRRRMSDALGATTRSLEACGWQLFASPIGGKFVWARVPHIEDQQQLIDCAAACGVTIAPGSYFRPHGEPSPWIRINAAYAQDPRALRFFERAAALEPNDDTPSARESAMTLFD